MADFLLPGLVGACCFCAGLGVPPSAVVEGGSLRPRSERPDLFVSPGRFLFDQVLSPLAERPVHLVAPGRRIALPHGRRINRNGGPLRVIELSGGDRFAAEIVDWQNDSLTVRLPGGALRTISNAAVETIQTPPEESELLAERFEDNDVLTVPFWKQFRSSVIFDAQRSAGGSRSLRLPLDRFEFTLGQSLLPEATRIQLWFCSESSSSGATGPESVPISARVTFQFVEPATGGDLGSLTLALNGPRLTAHGKREADPGWTTQSIELRTGWHVLTMVVSPSQMLAMLDGQLLASRSRTGMTLHSIQVTSTGGMLIDDLLVSSLRNPGVSLALPVLNEFDAIVMPLGDEFIGRVTRLDQTGVTMQGVAGDSRIPWSHIARVSFQRREQPPAATVRPTNPDPATSGLSAQIIGFPFVDRPRMDPDVLTVQILDSDPFQFFVAHPQLGEFPIAWRDISRIDPLATASDLATGPGRKNLRPLMGKSQLP